MKVNVLFLCNFFFSWIGEKIGVEYLYSQTGKQLVNLDHDEPDGLTEDTPEDLDDEGFEEILSCYDDSTVTALCLEMALPSREQGEQESQKEPMPVYGKYTTKWNNNNNNTITYGSIFIFHELITFGHFISFLFSSLRHVRWAEQWAFGCR